MEDKKYSGLAAEALSARERAYAPYSRFRVGAALLASGGKIYTGCNVENASYPATVCAERVAVLKAVSEGERSFEAIAVAGGRDGTIYCPPCGQCLQVMAEFCGPDFVVVFAKSATEYETHTLGELLPCAFSPEVSDL